MIHVGKASGYLRFVDFWQEYTGDKSEDPVFDPQCKANIIPAYFMVGCIATSAGGIV